MSRAFFSAHLHIMRESFVRLHYISIFKAPNGDTLVDFGQNMAGYFEFTVNAKKGEVVELTQIEFQILECFFNEPGKSIDRKYILNKVWGDPYYGDDKVVDVNIRRLRLKLEESPSNPRHLITIWGQGYCWKE